MDKHISTANDIPRGTLLPTIDHSSVCIWHPDKISEHVTSPSLECWNWKMPSYGLTLHPHFCPGEYRPKPVVLDTAGPRLAVRLTSDV